MQKRTRSEGTINAAATCVGPFASVDELVRHMRTQVDDLWLDLEVDYSEELAVIEALRAHAEKLPANVLEQVEWRAGGTERYQAQILAMHQSLRSIESALASCRGAVAL